MFLDHYDASHFIGSTVSHGVADNDVESAEVLKTNSDDILFQGNPSFPDANGDSPLHHASVPYPQVQSPCHYPLLATVLTYVFQPGMSFCANNRCMSFHGR